MKKIISMFLTMALCVGLVGCGSSSEKEPNTTSSSPIETNTEETSSKGDTFSDLLDEMEKEEQNKQENKDSFFDKVDATIGGDYSSDIDYLGTLKDSTNEFSFVLGDSYFKEFVVFTYNFENVPSFKMVGETLKDYNLYSSYFYNAETGNKLQDEGYSITFEKSLSMYQQQATMRSNSLVPGLSNEASVSFKTMYVLNNEEYDTLETFKEANKNEKDIDKVWQYKNYYIIGGTAYTITDFNQTGVEISLYGTSISDDQIKAFLDNLTIEFTTSEKGFDSSKCYYEDAIANEIANSYKIYIKNPATIVNTYSSKLQVYVDVDNSSTSEKYCEIEIDDLRKLSDEYNYLGRYEDYLLREKDGKYSLIYMNESNEYIEIRFSNKMLDLDLIRENFLN